jgi:hypothetical protein
MRIRIRIRIQFQIRIQGFDDQNIKILQQLEQISFFLNKKLQFIYPQTSMQDVQAIVRSLHLSKENILNFKT